MKSRKNYIKELEYRFFNNFESCYLNVKYFRNGEFNDITFCNIDKFFSGARNERNVRKFINK